MSEILLAFCLVYEFGKGSSNECFFVNGDTFQTEAACMRQADIIERKTWQKLRKEYGDDYIYLVDAVCADKSRGT